MSLIKLVGIGDIQEQLQCPEGAYSLVVAKAKLHTAKGASEPASVELIIDIEDDENYASLFYYMSFPKEGDTEEGAAFKLLLAKRVLYYLDLETMIDGEEFETEDLIGQRSIIQIPVTIDPPTDANNNREGRKIQWPPLPTEE